MERKTKQTHNNHFPNTLQQKLNQRREDGALRTLKSSNPNLADFSSNDYLGFSQSKIISDFATGKLNEATSQLYGATGSRLLTGNYDSIEKFEDYLAQYYNTEASTVFNSGYDANIGLLSSIGQRQDLILYDELCHASIRDGISLSKAKAYKFQHNNLEDLEAKLNKFQSQFRTIYVVTEHVFSMDGDSADVTSIIDLCIKYKVYFILDEAHSVGVFNKTGCSELSPRIFARVVTFGKAFGSHGATVLGSVDLKQYLINFAKSFIYTTAPSQETTARNWAAHEYLERSTNEIEMLKSNINCFLEEVQNNGLTSHFIQSQSAIQSCIIGGNDKVKSISNQLQEQGFDVRAILSPTVPKGKERLRFCLHSYNTIEEISSSLRVLSKLIGQ